MNDFRKAWILQQALYVPTNGEKINENGMKKLKQNEEAYKRRFESWWFSFFSVSNQTALIDNNDVNE